MTSKEEIEKDVEGFKAKVRSKLKAKALQKKKGIDFNGADIHGDRHRRAQLHREMKPFRIFKPVGVKTYDNK